MSDPIIDALTQQVASLQITPSGDFAESAAQAAAVGNEEAQVYNLPFDRTFPDFNPMVDDVTFLDDEHNSPISLLNNNYWQAQKALDNYESIKKRAESWFEPCGLSNDELIELEAKYKASVEKLIAEQNPKFDRIFIRDAERCFNAPKRRTAICHILTYLQAVSLKGDYHQGLAMLCSFLSCFLSAPKVIAMAIRANEKLLPEVWKSRSEASVIDGHVLYGLLKNSSNPKFVALYNHLKSVMIIPEMFMPKYWCGLTVHLLPFQSIVTLFDNFWVKHGVLALYECIFLILLGQYDALMKADNTSNVFDLVQLDHHILTPKYVNELTYCYPEGVVPEYAKEAAELIKLIEDPEVLMTSREEAFRVHIEPLIARTEQDFAALTAAAPDCARAECGKPQATGEYFCLDCKIHLCEDCAYSAWDGHNDDDHEIRANFDLD
jgi:hypothetical protein